MKKIKYLLFLFFLFSFANVKALALDQTKYEELNMKRAYVVCEYVFDLSKYNPSLKDLLIAAQSCPTDKVTVYEILMMKDLNGNMVRTYKELISGTNSATFPKLDLKEVYTGAIGTSNKRVLDSSPSTVTHTLNTKTISQTLYDNLNIKRSYVVGPYIFDISKHNPTLQDLMLANQYGPRGTAEVIEIKALPNLSGTIEKSYTKLLAGGTVTTFPTFEGRYVFRSIINPENHNKESRTDLITNETIDNGPKENEVPDPRSKPIDYSTKCMGYITIPGTDGVVNNICVRWKDKSKNSNAEANNVSTGIYTLPVSNYPNVKNGNLVLAAHSGSANISYFKTLWKLKVGNTASIKFNGNNYTYVIKDIYLVPKTGVVKIKRNSTKTTLTLITCTKNDEAHQTVYILELRDIDGVEYQ